MARLLLAWELGGGLGHAQALTALADALLRRGHAVDLAWKDLSVAGAVLGERLRHPRLRLWPAPVWTATLANMPEPANHAELLFRAGYLDAGRLAGLARGWRTLLEATGPALLVADHAPTALLAARGQPLRRLLFGNGFCIPPAEGPWPAFREWETPAPAQRLAAAETRVQRVCDAVLAGLGEPPLPSLAALYAADERVLLGWPELDPLRPWRGRGPQEGRHWGLPASPPGGAAPGWPDGEGPRVLGYLRATHPAAAPALGALQAGPARSLVYLDGVTPEDAQRLDTPWLRVSAEPIDLAAALPQAQAFVGMAGAGTTLAALSAGVPVVLLPMQAEQLLFARRVVAAGAGVLLWPQEVAAGLGRAVAAVLGSPGFADAVRALAACQRAVAGTGTGTELHAGRPGAPAAAGAAPAADGGPEDPVIAAIARRCEALLEN